MNIFVQPLGLLLRIIFDITGNYGLSIIAFTVIVKLAMVPLTLNQTKSMKKMQEIQPLVKELQDQYKDDQQSANQKVMELYKEHKVSPLGGCLPALIQIPIIFSLFSVLRTPMDFGLPLEAIRTGFMVIPNLSEADPWILPLLAGATTYLSTMMSTAMAPSNKKDPSQSLMKYFFPIMIFWSSKSFPAGLALYWTVGNLFQLIQQGIINRPVLKPREATS